MTRTLDANGNVLTEAVDADADGTPDSVTTFTPRGLPRP